MKRLARTAITLVALLALGTAMAATATAPATPAGTWSWTAPTAPPGELAFASTLSEVSALACAPTGRCVAIGVGFDQSTIGHLFISERTAAGWGQIALLSGVVADPSVTTGMIRQANCAPDGACAVTGQYFANGSNVAFVDTLDGSGSIEIPGLAALDVGHDSTGLTIACSSAGNCSVVGYYLDAQSQNQVWVADQVDGVWGAATQVTGFVGTAGPTSISCAVDGDCVLVGVVVGSPNSAFVLERTSGVWGAPWLISPMLPPGMGSQLTGVSCPTAGFCLAIGFVVPTSTIAMTMTRVDGAWSSPAPVPGLAAISGLDPSIGSMVSCWARGMCAIAGFTAVGSDQAAWVADMASETFSDAQLVPGVQSLGSGHSFPSALACSPTGVCVLGGRFRNLPSYDAFLTERIDGVWSPASVLAPMRSGQPSVNNAPNAAGCTSEHCSIGGSFSDSQTSIGWITDLTFTPTPPSTTVPQEPVAPAFTG